MPIRLPALAKCFVFPVTKASATPLIATSMTMSSSGSDVKGRVLMSTSTGSEKASSASISSNISPLFNADALTCSGRRATSRYSNPSFEVHQRHNFFTKDHPQYLSSCSAARPDSGHERRCVEHYLHFRMISQVISLYLHALRWCLRGAFAQRRTT